MNEGLKLEAALAQLEIRKEGRPHALRPDRRHDGRRGRGVPRAYLGTTRLTAPCEAFGAIAVFHGHAHHGSLEGRTPKGIPVYNVAMPLLKKALDRRFRVIEL